MFGSRDEDLDALVGVAGAGAFCSLSHAYASHPSLGYEPNSQIIPLVFGRLKALRLHGLYLKTHLPCPLGRMTHGLLKPVLTSVAMVTVGITGRSENRRQ